MNLSYKNDMNNDQFQKKFHWGHSHFILGNTPYPYGVLTGLFFVVVQFIFTV